jgi:hypothetical protein
VTKTLTSAISRRTLLLAAAGLAASAVLTRRLWQPDGLAQSVADIVKRSFGDDIAPDSVLREFASYYVRTRSESGYLGRRRKMQVRLYGGFAALIDAVSWIDEVEEMIATVEEQIGDAFIRNTNMTYRERGEPIVFAEEPAIEPYTCRNHIARFDYED